MLPIMLGEFRAGGDAELRFTPGGQAVANFSIIANKAKKEGDEWVTTGETGWLRVTAWGTLAERCANDVTRGCRVYVVGEYEVKTYQRRDGDGEGTSIELTAKAVEVIPPRDDSRQQGGGYQTQPQGQRQPAADPWGAGPSTTDEPPF